MAKVILGPMVAQASGAIGGTVFSRNRAGTYVRRRAHPTIVTSLFAEEVKTTFASVSAAWSDLAAASRSAFTIWAANHPIVDRVGSKITLDGHAAYTKLNANQHAAGGSAIELPPVLPPPDGLTSLTLEPAMVSSTLIMKWTPSQLATSAQLMIRAAVTTSPARNYVKGTLRLCGFSAEGLVSQLDIVSLVQNRIGTLQTGDQLHLEVCTYNKHTGQASLPLSDSGTLSAFP